jgi:oligopeptidase B
VVGIAFDDPAYVTWLAYNPEPERRAALWLFSMTTPDTLFELDMDTGEQVIKQTEVAGFEPKLSQRAPVGPARDGVEVPVSLVYTRKHFRKGKIRYWSTATARMAPAWMLISAVAG